MQVRGTIEYLSMTEAAKRLRLNTRMIRAAIMAGELQAYQFTDGGWYYFLPEDLDAWLESCKVEVA